MSHRLVQDNDKIINKEFYRIYENVQIIKEMTYNVIMSKGCVQFIKLKWSTNVKRC